MTDPLTTFLAVVEAWGRGEVIGYDVLDAAAAYLDAVDATDDPIQAADLQGWD